MTAGSLDEVKIETVLQSSIGSGLVNSAPTATKCLLDVNSRVE
jgi:hypothetical protein